MDSLRFVVKRFPELHALGAGYVVIAYHGEWRDGDATSDLRQIPRIQRELRKRFMARLPANLALVSSPPGQPRLSARGKPPDPKPWR